MKNLEVIVLVIAVAYIAWRLMVYSIYKKEKPHTKLSPLFFIFEHPFISAEKALS